MLEMFEAWLGEETVERAVRRYLARHAWGNATAADLVAALSEEAGRDLSGPLSTFLDQTGAPLVSVDLECPSSAPAVLRLEQKPYRPAGARDRTPQAWQVPICARYGTGESSGRACTLLTGATAELVLPADAGCPDWIVANEGGRGYYRPRQAPKALAQLVEGGGTRLTAPERVAFVGDLSGLMASGDLPAGEALVLMAPLAADSKERVVSSILAVVRSVAEWVPERLQSQYAAFVRRLYAKRARAMGWASRKDEDDETRLLRQAVIEMAGIYGEDAELGSQAVALSRRWLSDPKAVDPDMVDVVLPLASRFGDRALFDSFRDLARQTPDRKRREQLLWAVGFFREPALVSEGLTITLADDIDARESILVLFAAAQHSATRESAYAFIKSNYDALAARLPHGSVFSPVASFPRVGRRFCDEKSRTDLAAFFSPRADRFAGGPRILDQALEEIDLCIAQRRLQEPSLVSFLQERRAGETHMSP